MAIEYSSEEWQTFATNTVVTLIFAWMVYTLFNIILSFRGDELRLSRDKPQVDSVDSSETDIADSTEQQVGNWRESAGHGQSTSHHEKEKETFLGKGGQATSAINTENTFSAAVSPEDTTETLNPVVEEGGALSPVVPTLPSDSGKEQTLAPDDGLVEDDWEGIETSDLEDSFNAAATLVASSVAGQTKFTPSLQLSLYGLYKQATEGVCEEPQPSIFNPRARAKWDAWKQNGDMTQEEAMENYITLVQNVFKDSKQMGSSSEGAAGNASGLGPVFSSLADKAEDQSKEDSLEDLAGSASLGNLTAASQWLDEGRDINAFDEEGRTALHWAADRGHLEMVKLLINRGAQTNVKDGEGQTPLHYAVVCEHQEVAMELLLKGADPNIEDNEGATPSKLRPKQWTWPA